MSHLDALLKIFEAGVKAVDPYQIIIKSLHLYNNKLRVNNHDIFYEVDLSKFSKIFVVGVGKAACKMCLGVENILKDKITKGITVTKYGHTGNLRYCRLFEAGHPLPDGNGVLAAEEIYKLLEEADAETLVINLISGGGSALLPMPLKNGSHELFLEDKQLVTKALLKAGANIHEMNTVRKHLSMLKGGKFLKILQPAKSFNLILSDVIGDNLDTIASGLTYFDNTTFEDAIKVIIKYNLDTSIPENVMEVLKDGVHHKIPETLKDEEFKSYNTKNIIIGSNLHALGGAQKEAKSLGYETEILTDSMFGEAREGAKFILSMGRFLKKSGIKKCLLFGGETTVNVKGSGLGGRNQEMVLSFLSELNRNDEGIYFLSAGTDGNDGPTDAAGACCYYSEEISKDEIFKHLGNNDSYNFFKKYGGLVKTGPTNTNICDIQVLIVAP